MDGFNIIPKDGMSTVDIPRPVSQTRPVVSVGGELSAVKPVGVKKNIDVVWWLMIVSVVAAVGYIGYVVTLRFLTLSQIAGVSQELTQLQASFNKNEIADLKTVDQRLKLINSRLGNHILTAAVFDTINQHIRTTTQVSEYKVAVTESELNVSLSAIAPTFKDMAEQTERLFVMKDQNLIKSFTITNLAYEQDTRRVRFTVKLILDKSRYSALGVRIVKQS